MGERAKILLLDDDPDYTNPCRQLLEEDDYAVVVIPDGSEGFYAFHLEGCDLLILNATLPGLDGVEVLKKIRAQKRFEDFPIIVVVSSFRETIYKEVCRNRPQLVLPKTHERLPDLRKAVNSLLFSAPSDLELELGQVSRGVAATPPPRHQGLNRNGAARKSSRAAASSPVAEAGPITMVAECETSLPPALLQAAPIAPSLALPAVSDRTTTAPCAEIVKALGQAPREDPSKTELLLDLIVDDLTRLRHFPRDQSRLRKDQKDKLEELFNDFHTLDAAGCPAFEHITELARLLEKHILHLQRNPVAMTRTATQTLAQGMDILKEVILRRNVFKPAPSHRRTVVIVEPDQSYRLVLKMAVQKLGATPCVFSQEAEAMSLLQSQAVDLVILAVDCLPMLGRSLCQNLRESSLNAKTPVILVTSANSLALKVRCHSIGDAIILARPFGGSEFELRVGLVFQAPVMAFMIASLPKPAQAAREKQDVSHHFGGELLPELSWKMVPAVTKT